MGIRYDEQSAGFILDTENTTYAIGIADEEGFVGHAYYGHKLSELDTSYLMRVKNSDTVPSRNNRDRCGFLNAFPAEFPGNHAGDYREPAIEVLDGNGHRGVCFFYKSHAIFAGKKKLPGLPATFGSKEECETLELMLEDPVLKLQAVLERETPGITRSTVLRAQRFNQDLSPGCLLVEVGAAGNTHDEALRAAGKLAEGILALAAENSP